MVSSLQCTSSHHFTNVLPSATIILTSFCHHPTITIITHCCVPISYLGVTIGSYHKHEVEPYDNAKELRKSEQEVHQKKMKGGHFKLNGHPKGYFHPNPFRADKALPPIDEPRTSKDKPKPFKPSSPAKKAGGCKAGTFDHYPKHSEDPYSPAKQKSSGKDSVRKIFKPSPGPKSMPTKSVVTQSVHRRMNVTNFMQTTPVT
jgi:hypothetical protein